MGTEQQQQQNTQGQPPPSADDLGLVDERLEDEVTDSAALWAEFDREEGTAAADSDTTADDPPPDAGREKSGDEERAAAAAEDDRSTDSAAAAGENAPARESTSDGSEQQRSEGQQQQTEDLWSSATAEQRAAFEAAQTQLRRLEHAERSNRGRLSAMQRQIDELTAAPRQGTAAASKEAAKGEAGKATGQQQDDPDGFLASEDWKSFAGEYPEVAAPLGKLIGSMQTQITRQAKELSAIGAERRADALSEQAEILVGEHPDWQQVTADRGFPDWLKGQPRHIREAALRNADEIVDAAEAADVVGRFKQFRASEAGGSATRQPNPSAAGNGQDSSNPRLAGRRQRQLESASTARSRGPGAASGIPEDGDPETIWKQFDEKERRERRA